MTPIPDRGLDARRRSCRAGNGFVTEVPRCTATLYPCRTAVPSIRLLESTFRGVAMSMKTALSAIAFACLLPTAAAAQAATGWPEVVKQFDVYVQADQVVGASILYMRDGK